MIKRSILGNDSNSILRVKSSSRIFCLKPVERPPGTEACWESSDGTQKHSVPGAPVTERNWNRRERGLRQDVSQTFFKYHFMGTDTTSC